MANPKLFIMGIGGTGGRVLRSLTMLLAAGDPSFDNYDIYPVIIDYDENNADKKRATDILTLYKQTHDDAYNAYGTGGVSYKPGIGRQFFGADIKEIGGIQNFTFQFKLPEGRTKFSDFIQAGSLAGSTYPTSELLSSLYDTSTNNDTTELNIDMSVGFKGNPNIGSVVLNDMQTMPLFQNLINSYNTGNQDRIVIVGSLFGGTGASGIPALVQAIRKQKPGAHIATVLVLPYFEPNKPFGEGAIDARLFYSKTKAAINYYKDSGLNNEVENIYTVGDFYPTHIAYSEGGENQRNNANLVELISGLAIAHYAKQNIQDLKPDTEYKFSIKKSIVVNKGNTNNSQRLFVEDFIDPDSSQAMLNLKILCIALKFYKENVVSGKEQTSLPYFKLLGLKDINREKPERSNGCLERVCEDLNKFYTELSSWMSELDFAGDQGSHLEANSHRLALFDMEKSYDDIVQAPVTGKEATKENFTQKILGSLKSKKDRAGYISARIGDHFNTNHMREGKDLKTEQKEYAFIDSLHRAAVDAEEEFRK